MRLTLREKELLNLLKREPMITQEELSRRLGITRSSVAVHISNLMKKGVVLGKGYVLNEYASVVVIGESCINVSIQGEDVNTRIDIDFGGFAIDLSRALAQLNVNVKVITVTGNDEIGDEIINRLREADVDTSNIYRHSKRRSCRQVMVNNLPAYEELYPWKEYDKALALREWVVLNSEWICIDPKFQEDILNKLGNKNEDKLPNMSTYRILNYPEEVPAFLKNYSTLVLGVKGKYLDYYVEKIKPLVFNKNWLITDGHTRVVYYKDGKAVDIPLLPNQFFNIKSVYYFYWQD